MSSTLVSSSWVLPEHFFQIVHKAQKVIGHVFTGTHAAESPICCCAFDRNEYLYSTYEHFCFYVKDNWPKTHSSLFNVEAQFVFGLTCILVLCHVSCFVLDQKSYMSYK